MSFLSDFYHTRPPDPGTAQPTYYRKAMSVCNQIMAVYYLLVFGLILLRFLPDGRALWMLFPLGLLAVTLLIFFRISKINARLYLWLFSLIIMLWCTWFIYRFGWSCGVQALLLPVLILIFFNIYESPLWKLLFFMLLLTCRMFLFSWSLQHPALSLPGPLSVTLFQILNSATVFVMLAACCILFSTNLQDTERQLRIDNQTLHREAETDALTQLPNRRFMLDEMELFRQKSSTDFYSVAIADIDFFKRVNDTYGHACGDYTLKALADLFREKATARVCRWGGEEFCFFLPGRNLDQAGVEMNELCHAVRKMKLSYEGHDFSITVTIGIAENDFISPIESILEEADRKLYLGKSNGRNQVVL